ncbi:hypothetical protein [Bifidobacterium felsineum]|uniref:hypothetical protein n=1 Tax=Bifidobacterium felsineum TaxID=2045440 RepID=UPI001BDD556E|nr:hypothetical protein [Bifidobacterium felsineum]MBT1164596.1 hypothetical protein [Bifidobacterium felsineum]
MAVLDKPRTLVVEYESGATLTGPVTEDQGNLYVRLDGTMGLCIQHYDGRLAHGVVSIRTPRPMPMREADACR